MGLQIVRLAKAAVLAIALTLSVFVLAYLISEVVSLLFEYPLVPLGIFIVVCLGLLIDICYRIC
jgi:hypothetical protein